MIFVTINISSKCVRSINEGSGPHMKDTHYNQYTILQNFISNPFMP